MAYVSEPPIACSLTAREQVERAAEARELIGSALAPRCTPSSWVGASARR